MNHNMTAWRGAPLWEGCSVWFCLVSVRIWFGRSGVLHSHLHDVDSRCLRYRPTDRPTAERLLKLIREALRTLFVDGSRTQTVAELIAINGPGMVEEEESAEDDDPVHRERGRATGASGKNRSRMASDLSSEDDPAASETERDGTVFRRVVFIVVVVLVLTVGALATVLVAVCFGRRSCCTMDSGYGLWTNIVFRVRLTLGILTELRQMLGGWGRWGGRLTDEWAGR